MESFRVSPHSIQDQYHTHDDVRVERCGPGASGNVYYLRRLHSNHPSNSSFRRVIGFVSGKHHYNYHTSFKPLSDYLFMYAKQEIANEFIWYERWRLIRRRPFLEEVRYS